MIPKLDIPIKLYFYKFLKGGKRTLKIGDIELLPEYDEYSDKVYWTLENPNDSSYSSYTLEGYIEESVDEFSKFTNPEFYKELVSKQKLETPTAIYITPETELRFLKEAKKTTKFKYKELQMDIYPFDINIRMDSDGIYFDVFVVCHNPYDTDEKTKLTYVELKDKLNYYKEWDSYFDYTDNLFNDLQDYIWNNHPALFNNEYMLTQGGISYFTPTHKQLKLW